MAGAFTSAPFVTEIAPTGPTLTPQNYALRAHTGPSAGGPRGKKVPTKPPASNLVLSAAVPPDSQQLAYTAVFHPEEEGGYSVTVPALPGAISQGDTLEEARENIREAVLGVLESRRKRGLSIPTESNNDAAHEKLGTTVHPLQGHGAPCLLRGSPTIRGEIEVDTWIAMPHHLRGIIWIKAPDLTGAPGAPGNDATSPGNSPWHVGAHGRAPLPKVGSIPLRPPRSLGSFVVGFKSGALRLCGCRAPLRDQKP